MIEGIQPFEASGEIGGGDGGLIDTREPHEDQGGHLEGGKLVPPGVLGDQIEAAAPGQSAPAILFLPSRTPPTPPDHRATPPPAGVGGGKPRRAESSPKPPPPHPRGGHPRPPLTAENSLGTIEDSDTVAAGADNSPPRSLPNAAAVGLRKP